MKTKIVVVIEDGCVTAAYCSDGNAELEVIDRDDLATLGEHVPSDEEIATSGLVCVY